ncbi:MAG: hypothetical protein KME04_11545 [Pleurocapsa minor GSE-CHR-MK-17-07R]|jgi:hypothetical protein|nr:hypothetical protein [Pleurocapsa minor GSE-CHR-MK 17-07R]
MMSALEQEIIEKFHRLEPAAKQRVLETLSLDVQISFDYAGWWLKADALQASIRSRLGDQASVGALSLLDELREEES